MSIPCICRFYHQSKLADVQQDYPFENIYMSIYYTCRVSPQCESTDVGQDNFFENMYTSTRLFTFKRFFLGMNNLMSQQYIFE